MSTRTKLINQQDTRGKKPVYKQFLLLLEENMMKALEEEAKKNGVAKAAIVKIAIRNYLKS